MAKALSESTREREAYKYSSLFSNAIYNDRPTPLPDSELSTSADTVLTALAQLGTHRTKTSRSLISLFDAKWQYVVAEATPDMPLGPGLRHSERDGEELWLCGTAIPRSSGLCEHYLAPQATKECGRAELPVTFVKDLQSDNQFSGKPYYVTDSLARFYAAVPIRSARGIDIGVLCIFHNEPMDGGKEWERGIQKILSTISSAIMAHLDSERMKLEHRRSQRMVRGVGSFVEKASTLTEWQEGPNPSAFKDVVGMEGALNCQQQDLDPERRSSAGKGDNKARQRARDLSSVGDANANLHSPEQRDPSRSTPVERIQPDLPQTHQGGLHDIFSRAANLIRESIEVEGVVFLDADIGSFGSRIHQYGPNESAQGTPLATSSSDEAHSGSDHGGSDRCCSVLGFSTTDTSSINNDRASRTQISIPGKVLSTFLRRYPGGKIWRFDEHGSLQSSESSGDDNPTVFTPVIVQRLAPRNPGTKSRQPWARAREGSTLSAIFPGVRSVAFVPAWNEATGRWHSGCFVYSFQPTRVFTTAGELSYLRAFAVLIIAEVARRHARFEIKAQNDILNSISHELRSPLHGVILGVELLQDTILDTFQSNIIHTVETCGRTLLDTIDHLLDFSNINNFLRVDKKAKQQKRIGGPSTIETGMKNLLVEVNIDALVEEVVESVFAGHNFQRLSIGGISRTGYMPAIDDRANRRLDCMKSLEELGSTRRESDAAALSNDAVFIHLDIEPGMHRYLTTVGAIRRIVMNLFGNALKYTQKGAIRVSLSRVTLSVKKHQRRQHTVRITVSDTGQGMSESYINHKLYKPFNQENDLSPGTGLGLSLVKGIVSSLGGEISIKSKLDVGTIATVQLPLAPADVPLEADTNDSNQSEFLSHKRQLKGLRVHLNGLPQTYTTVSSDPFVNLPTVHSSSTETVCRDWLQLEIAERILSYPDIVLCSEAVIDAPDGLSSMSGNAPIVVVCSDAVAAHSRTLLSRGYMGGRVVEFISQPAGPRKLAKILLLAIKRWVDLQDLQTPDSSMDNLASFPLSPFTAPPTPFDLDTIPIMERPIVIRQDSPSSLPPSPVETPRPFLPFTPPREKPPAEFLLVDDNPVNLRILRAFMRKLGRTYGTADDGEEAVAAFKASSSDYKCVFMDISMPRLDGMAATRAIRKYEHDNQREPATIIALTGLASAVVQKEAFESGMNLFLTKPVMLKELKSILKKENYI